MLRPKPSRGVAQISISIADLYALDKAEVAKVLTKKIRKYRPIKVRERANSLIAKRALLRYKVSTPAIVKPNAQDSIIKALRNPTMEAKVNRDAIPLFITIKTHRAILLTQMVAI